MLLLGTLIAAVGAGLLTWVGSLVGLRLFPEFRSREQKSGEYRRDAVSAAAAGRFRLPCVVGPAMFLALATVLIGASVRFPADAPRLLYVLGLSGAEWFLGWLDDLKKARGLGLSERLRLAAHGVIALGAAVAYVRLGFAGHGDFWTQLGSALIVMLAILYVTLSAGFSDGVEGLTAGMAALSGLSYAVLAGIWGIVALSIAAAATCGAAGGAMLVNTPSNWTRTGTVRRRARGYLGDSGALLAGAAVVGLAVMSGTIALLPLLAAGFVVEGGTVFLQTGLLTPLFRRGLRQRRLAFAETFVPHTEFPLPFLATPLHHHLNLIGLKPLQVEAFFWLQQLVVASFGLGALLFAPPWLRIACGLLGLAALLAPPAVLAATRSLFLGRVDGPEEVGLLVCRGLPISLGSWPVYRVVERLPGVVVGPADAGWLEHPLPRYEALCRAALLAARCGQEQTAAALLRRVPALNLLLRPEAALLAAAHAQADDQLSPLIESWRRALQPVYQAGRLDLTLERLAELAECRSDADLAARLRAHIAAPPLAASSPKRWR